MNHCGPSSTGPDRDNRLNMGSKTDITAKFWCCTCTQWFVFLILAWFVTHVSMAFCPLNYFVMVYNTGTTGNRMKSIYILSILKSDCNNMIWVSTNSNLSCGSILPYYKGLKNNDRYINFSIFSDHTLAICCMSPYALNYTNFWPSVRDP